MPPAELFEQLITDELKTRLLREQRSSEQADLEVDEAPLWLARHAARELHRALESSSGPEAMAKQVALTNRVLELIRSECPDAPAEQTVSPPGALLFSIHDGVVPTRTELPFAVSALLTRARNEPALGHELSREIETAERIDALVSFVTHSGFRCLESALERHARAGRRLRLLTTTYMGATEADAVEAIATLPGVEVRISYDARVTRLHAKAWLFERPNGLSTAYVGSANLSRSALFAGHEWMLKAAHADLSHVLEKFRGAFESLWESPEFEPYSPSDEAHRERLRAALKQERHEGGAAGRRWFFDLKPYPFQQEILERLNAERVLHGRTRNLVVAATGTGKTVLAAFDYARQAGRDGLRPRLLFVAHREELLRQALDAFRHVLRDESFGALLAGGSDLESTDHLFATVQSVASRGLLQVVPADHWDFVVIDECHHAPAQSYRALLEQLRPKLLLGLTATPERSDGQSLLPDFDHHIGAELRLWSALDRQLLAPFEYYGLHDGTDLTSIRWSRGSYAADALSELYTGNHRRAALIAEQLRKRVGSDGLSTMRALGFCVSVEHAQFMARFFSEHGIASAAIHGGSTAEERLAAPRDLEHRRVNVLFTADLYNEGVDLPFVDTLLLLRPTSSVTLFLQQLGRGLRLHPDKQSCLVLDFIGQHHEQFRFAPLLSGMTGLPRAELVRAIERGFPTLPSGCHVDLDRVARDLVLQNVRSAVRGGARRLADEIGQLAASARPSLRTYLERSGRELHEIYDAGGWTPLLRAAAVIDSPQAPGEAKLSESLGFLLHVDDPERLRELIALSAKLMPHAGGATVARDLGAIVSQAIPYEDRARRSLQMAAYQVFPNRTDRFGPDEFVRRLAAHPEVCAELNELCALKLDEIGLAVVHPPPDPEFPLRVHRSYSRREVLTAVGLATEVNRPHLIEGVVRLQEQKVELLFVTLDKSHERFSPTTRYRDYAISNRLFHWQTQSQVTPTSPSGRRYLEQATNGWRFLLFVRPGPDGAFTYLGHTRYREHSGSRPMSITWELEIPIPGALLQQYAVLASG